MSLFVVSTKDGWVDLMRRGVDARGIDLEVGFNISALCKSIYVYIYIYIYVVLFTYF